MQPGDPEGVLNLQWESTKEAATCNWGMLCTKKFGTFR